MLLTPGPDIGAELADDETVRFSWSRSAPAATYRLTIKTDSGQVVHDQDHGPNTHVDIAGLPLDGTPFDAELVTTSGAQVQTQAYAFDEGVVVDERPAAINNFVDGDLVDLSTATEVTWDLETAGGYALQVGTIPGGSNLGVFDAGAGDRVVVPPQTVASGTIVYLTLWSIYGSVFVNTGVELEVLNDTPPTPTVVVSEPNHASDRTVGTRIVFDASGTVDAQDATEALEYKWRANKNKPWTKWKVGKLAKGFTYSKTGTKTVSVKVRNSRGLKARADLDVQIRQNMDPRASFSTDFDESYNKKRPGGRVTLDARRSYDHETRGRVLEARWRLGDACDWTAWSTDKKIKVEYEFAGAKEVKLQVRDEQGNVDSYKDDVHIEKLPFCHQRYRDRLPDPFGRGTVPSKHRDRNRSNCRPPAWCDVHCQAMRNVVCKYDEDGYIPRDEDVPGLCMNTSHEPEKRKYHYNWVSRKADVFKRHGLDLDRNYEPITDLVGLSKGELKDIGFSKDFRDELFDGDLWERAFEQRPTVRHDEVLDTIEDGKRSACENGSCFSIDYSNGAFPSWGDVAKSNAGFVLERLKDVAPKFFDDVEESLEDIDNDLDCPEL